MAIDAAKGNYNGKPYMSSPCCGSDDEDGTYENSWVPFNEVHSAYLQGFRAEWINAYNTYLQDDCSLSAKTHYAKYSKLNNEKAMQEAYDQGRDHGGQKGYNEACWRISGKRLATEDLWGGGRKFAKGKGKGSGKGVVNSEDVRWWCVEFQRNSNLTQDKGKPGKEGKGKGSR